MEMHHLRFSVLFSRKHLTGAGKYEDAQAYVINSLIKDRRIINIPFSDLKVMASNKQNFLTFLRNKTKELTFIQLKANSLATELKKINELRKEGALTEDEFQKIKQNIILSHDT
jgi:cell shape-determining protein MreC